MPPHDVDPLDDGLDRLRLAGRIDSAIEVVDDLEHLGEHFTPGPLDVLRDLTPQPQPRFLELARRLPVLADVLLDLLVLLGDLALELLDVGRLQRGGRRLAIGGPFGIVRPPAAVDDLHGDVVFVGHFLFVVGPSIAARLELEASASLASVRAGPHPRALGSSRYARSPGRRRFARAAG